MLDLILLDFHWSQLLQPQFYIDNGGLWLVLFIIFAETGLFAGFFLPGDSLLFVAGIFSTQLAATIYDTGSDFLNLLMVIALTSVAGIAGNVVGFWTGRWIGPAMYTWKDRLLFKQRYLHQAKDFYDKHGGGAIVFARFLPIIRTFAPFVAGIGRMSYGKFMSYNVSGALLWIFSLTLAGYFFGGLRIVQENFSLVILMIIFLSIMPGIIEYVRERKRIKRAGL